MADSGDMDIGDNNIALPPPSDEQQLRQLYQQRNQSDHFHRGPGLDEGVWWRMIEDQQEALDLVFDELDFHGRAARSAAAVAALEKETFHAAGGGGGGGGGGVTECAICLEGFEDGEEVSVMPCFHGHGFYSDCITKWLGRSNKCPLCRHQLPTD